MEPIARGLADIRRAAISAQLLDGRATSIMEVARKLGYLQLDPTNAVARSHLLVLWSRLGCYDVADLDRLLWEERKLYEYSAAIVPTEDHPLHRATMRRYPDWPGSVWTERVRSWMRDNESLRRSLLAELRRRGPLLSRDLADLSTQSWRSSGWTEGRNVNRMLDFLAAQGKVLVAGRRGQQRLWDLAERVLPATARGAPALRMSQVEERVAERSLRALGVATPKQIAREYFVGGPYPGMAGAIEALVRKGRAVPVEVSGVSGRWLAHADDLALPGPPSDRTTLLSPFDPLIRDRERTEAIFGFRFRLEIYVPKAQRRYGYFVLPVLHRDRLVGRIDPLYDRRTGTLRVNAVHAEPGAPASAGPPLAGAIEDLARWLGARDLRYGSVAKVWARSLRS
ncbi:MAG TPA: crosslink repair DNA glycosylase YcaQ family protein [Actinomycetota bacterium]|nr:crosslink repair DNA glycosylase YcaQ family protein [Actinomycetota bacterium]